MMHCLTNIFFHGQIISHFEFQVYFPGSDMNVPALIVYATYACNEAKTTNSHHSFRFLTMR